MHTGGLKLSLIITIEKFVYYEEMTNASMCVQLYIIMLCHRDKDFHKHNDLQYVCVTSWTLKIKKLWCM